MKKGLLVGLIIGGAAAAAVAIYKSSKNKQCLCEDFDEDCDDCCCECEDEYYDNSEIPADKAEDIGIVGDACACDDIEEDTSAKAEDNI